jgi:hypothetical protein
MLITLLKVLLCMRCARGSRLRLLLHLLLLLLRQLRLPPRDSLCQVAHCPAVEVHCQMLEALNGGLSQGSRAASAEPAAARWCMQGPPAWQARSRGCMRIACDGHSCLGVLIASICQRLLGTAVHCSAVGRMQQGHCTCTGTSPARPLAPAHGHTLRKTLMKPSCALAVLTRALLHMALTGRPLAASFSPCGAQQRAAVSAAGMVLAGTAVVLAGPGVVLAGNAATGASGHA